MVLKEADSTNNYLKELLSNTKPVADGTVIMAESQYAGRGQQQNKWHSAPGMNLTFSLLLRPSFLPLGQQFYLTQAVSIGVVSALRQATSENVQVKWPNDIYFGDKKLGGILIENIVQGSNIKHSIVGIGLNVNQTDFPPEVPNPTSVKQILHSDHDLHQLLSQICAHIEAWYLKLKAGKWDEIRQAYLNNLYWLNQEREFSSDGVDFTGTITGITEHGFLVVRTESEEKEFNLKQIQFLNK
ncbi:biotin--[acetyl-CoA-carboxylase] ligase [Mucilaginibacter myungsuensis]|uniref:biotin--[acetyl-CoA-carboxylase] ligase n=1 Tax=Mucilaginibacter myungsuensis TaxID=649104 RepID=UPI0025B29986|nr:biotin--[acetyl-CoA-carboxylase] ligase [Mucilaginibacter myungsuensis]MDN3597766.1 biotin--[acetyl-CoA-carboxylase] ligase [Mucilaginibacter myungsuensis]